MCFLCRRNKKTRECRVVFPEANIDWDVDLCIKCEEVVDTCLTAEIVSAPSGEAPILPSEAD